MKNLRIIFVFLFLPFCSHAWNGIGHDACGAVAYYYLKNSGHTKTINAALAILKDHPWYNNPIWTSKLSGMSGEQREVALFMLASTFPDDSRDSSYGARPMTTWHYIDYPFVPAGQHVTGLEPETPNAETEITALLEKIAAEQPGKQKALDLCWILHLIEDVHQPLHATSLFTDNHPAGDSGGNATYLITAALATPQKLHSYWDGLIKGTFTTAPSVAVSLMNKPELQEARLTELNADKDVHSWIYKESLAIAKEKTYLGGQLKGTKAAPTTVPDSYDREATAIAERRVVLAGIRIGRELVERLK